MKILHIAPFNISGVPISFVKAERKLGHQSRLITLGKDWRNYEEDICLELPFLDFSGTRWIKKIVSHPSKLSVDNQLKQVKEIPIIWQPNGWAESLLVKFREWFWQSKIETAMQSVNFWDFDVYQLDGGLEFYRDGRIVRKLKEQGKKVICCYTGSDLRTRGVIPAIDSLIDLNVTLEFDHLELHPKIEHVFFPFDVDEFTANYSEKSEVIRVGHAPTNRAAKGSDFIISVIKELQKKYPVELVLIENVSYAESQKMKSGCQIFIDQIGDLGYGLNSLESLAMGIPTCSCLVQGFEEKYPDHPFVVIDKLNLQQKLVDLIGSTELRTRLSKSGRDWVQRHHSAVSVVQKIQQLLDL